MNKLKFVGWLTVVILLLYVGVATWVFLRNGVTWAEFSGTIGPLVGMFAGYWVRGET